MIKVFGPSNWKNGVTINQDRNRIQETAEFSLGHVECEMPVIFLDLTDCLIWGKPLNFSDFICKMVHLGQKNFSPSTFI